ncbi:flavin reductase family protein [Saccharopolyspora phatthalungensis]|uniref:Flavin reductase (DIM6/NTAB) family NADH-FMN oxidoreductase RutF n=1 Tax=Saccharopolyspora phatthalungensis TaxID=664693 RepID=A0A840PXU2_9PSEU|nr:flavin reductase family protein [Saccharopolyspora phatthalungensis]MBB5153126.1 flavin reductase (DIM6/NTAB) family NADH-FMN oxidoreductase RutF [Saccharopolyspora phatthalungensis]
MVDVPIQPSAPTVRSLPPHPAAVAVDDYRSLMSAFPTGVAVITTVDDEGKPHGLTCTSLSSVTLAPPTLLVCLHQHSGTLGALGARGGFAVNLLHARARHVAEIFSSGVDDRFGKVAWCAAPRTGAPKLVTDAFAIAECTVTGTHMVGDHAVVLGVVVGVAHVADVPLLYGMRRFDSWSHPSSHG